MHLQVKCSLWYKGVCVLHAHSLTRKQAILKGNNQYINLSNEKAGGVSGGHVVIQCFSEELSFHCKLLHYIISCRTLSLRAPATNCYNYSIQSQAKITSPPKYPDVCKKMSLAIKQDLNESMLIMEAMQIHTCRLFLNMLFKFVSKWKACYWLLILNCTI